MTKSFTRGHNERELLASRRRNDDFPPLQAREDKLCRSTQHFYFLLGRLWLLDEGVGLWPQKGVDAPRRRAAVATGSLG